LSNDTQSELHRHLPILTQDIMSTTTTTTTTTALIDQKKSNDVPSRVHSKLFMFTFSKTTTATVADAPFGS
jgi:hypothetical protein